MPRQFLNRYLPKHSEVTGHRSMRLFSGVIGNVLADQRLWHLNRRRVAAGVAIGCFVAFLPIPLQMVLAVILAIGFRANIPSAVVLVWLTNPLTILPIMWLCYRIGLVIMGQPPLPHVDGLTWEWFANSFSLIWQPLLLGCLLVGGFAAGLGHFLVMELWRLHVLRRWKRRARLYRFKLHHLRKNHEARKLRKQHPEHLEDPTGSASKSANELASESDAEKQ